MNRLFMRSLGIIFFLLSVANVLFAQTGANGVISGKVADAVSGKPVDFASLALVDAVSGKTVKGGQSAADGSFAFRALPLGTYTLKVSFLGYQPLDREGISLTQPKPDVNLGILKLAMGKASVLKEVVVEAKKSTIQLGVDRKVFSVEQNLVSAGGSATDILENVPTLSVDIDGNVSLRGTSNVRILIDGRPSAIGGGDIASLLQSLPASSIETVELITNPSSKYDAEGQTGIINIILKKNQRVGFNGGFSVSAGTLDNYNVNTNLSYRDGKINLYGNHSYRYSNREGSGFNNTYFLDNNSVLNNTTSSNRHNAGNTAKLGLDYYINDKTTLGVSGNVNYRSGDDTENINYLYQNYSSVLDGTSFRSADETEKDKGYDLSLDFIRKFARQGEELSANLSYGRSTEDENQFFNQDFYTFGGMLKDTLDRRTTANGQSRDNYNFQIDYILPFNSNQKLEAGYRGSLRKNTESQVSDRFNRLTQGFERDYFLTNDFDMDDQVHALYGNYQNQITEKFGFQFGLRAEQANLNTVYKSLDPASLEPAMAEGKLDYFRIYPSLFLTQKLKNDNQLQLSYTRRVNRPRGWQINPFRDIADPNNIRVGNPNLRPEDIHSFEFSHMKYWKAVTFTSSLYFRQVNDVVQGIQQRVDSTTTLTQFANLARNRATGLELISKADLFKGFNVTGNLNFFYNNFSGSEELNIASNDGINWNAKLMANAQILPSLSAQINMEYMARRVTAQGRGREVFGTDAALKLDVLRKKGSVSFNMRDIFNSRRWGGITETADFNREFRRRMMGRMSTLTFSYRFGNSDNQQRKRKQEEQQIDTSGEEF
ncbi:outer membrane receptor protein involved in Fe transport [Arcticibacter pallidicorallinus]|uniref:Outer membrane receptor protein involved in Fe transport n=2 Tax=Arcticibacter pallidicorallinus TaxID=1259464 RepID=A0A2T0U8T3_9SPHI|nr:outer membrane receptor protein involved in Fe transport [Arcticibacter pallidicorallinus]